MEPKTNYVFSDVEWAKMKHMTKAIWGVDLNAVNYFMTESKAVNIQFPVLDNNILPYWDLEAAAREMESPTFERELIELDRWLIPWKVKAGYSERLKLLVYKVVQ